MAGSQEGRKRSSLCNEVVQFHTNISCSGGMPVKYYCRVDFTLIPDFRNQDCRWCQRSYKCLPARQSSMIKMAAGANPWYESGIGYFLKFQKSNSRFQIPNQFIPIIRPIPVLSV